MFQWSSAADRGTQQVCGYAVLHWGVEGGGGNDTLELCKQTFFLS